MGPPPPPPSHSSHLDVSHLQREAGARDAVAVQDVKEALPGASGTGRSAGLQPLHKSRDNLADRVTWQRKSGLDPRPFYPFPSTPCRSPG
jgi:hypothetical protein